MKMTKSIMMYYVWVCKMHVMYLRWYLISPAIWTFVLSFKAHYVQKSCKSLSAFCVCDLELKFLLVVSDFHINEKRWDELSESEKLSKVGRMCVELRSECAKSRKKRLRNCFPLPPNYKTNHLCQNEINYCSNSLGTSPLYRERSLFSRKIR